MPPNLSIRILQNRRSGARRGREATPYPWAGTALAAPPSLHCPPKTPKLRSVTSRTCDAGHALGVTVRRASEALAAASAA
jgi:hypothetical protein